MNGAAGIRFKYAACSKVAYKRGEHVQTGTLGPQWSEFQLDHSITYQKLGAQASLSGTVQGKVGHISYILSMFGQFSHPFKVTLQICSGTEF